MRMYQVAALAVSVLPLGCGGGESDVPRTTASATLSAEAPAAVVGAPRPQALAAATHATSAATAERLMDFGENSFPQYFPGHEPTQSQWPFLYRYYPGTGAHLGVVVSAGGGYTPDGVYVLGGPFGSSPQFVGLLSAFITPDPPAGANNGCFDLELIETPGTRIVVSYQFSGESSGTSTEDSRVGDLVIFEGHEAREIASTIVLRTDDSTMTFEGRFYSRVSGAAAVTEFGNTSAYNGRVSGFDATVTSRSVWNPPTVDRRYGLAVGESISITETGTTTTTTRGVPGVPETPQESTDTSTTTVRYLGRERITVPAGTYDTCRFEETYDGGSSSSTSWVIVGKGIEVRIEDRSGGSVDSTELATAVSLNGVPL